MMDYEEVGFKCGLEIHQQLDTHKLFSHSPSIVHDGNPDIKIVRKLRATAGESGKTDVAAEYEKGKEKTMVYEGCSSSTDLVYIDEEPPHPLNQEALMAALQVAKMLHAVPVDELQFMRKTVIDGSNVSGFQRTGLIAIDGYVETSKGKVAVPTICLEEESAKKIKDSDLAVTYRLDRLGVPLIELATDPDIKDPEHAKEVAEKLGFILRSTGKVKRGIGSIRQDVNVSIKNGVRVEIKGFQDLKSIPKVIEVEISRQQELIKKGEPLQQEVRKAESNFTTSFLRPMPGAARMYPETDIPTIPLKGLSEHIEIPETLEERSQKLVELGLGEEVALRLVKKDQDVFMLEVCNGLSTLKASFVVDTFSSLRNQIEKEFKVKPEEVSDLEAQKIARNIAKNIEGEMQYPGEIKIHVIRESRSIEFAR